MAFCGVREMWAFIWRQILSISPSGLLSRSSALLSGELNLCGMLYRSAGVQTISFLISGIAPATGKRKHWYLPLIKEI